MVEINLKNSFSFYNNIIRMDGLQKSADGEYAATIYVIYSKIKNKINQLSYSDKTKFFLITKIEKWNKDRCFYFKEKYFHKLSEITNIELRRAILDVTNIKLSELNKII